MTALKVTLTAQQRLLLGVGSEVAYFTGSHSYVSGSVLRGALAAAWIAQHGPPTGGGASARRFRELFDGGIRYGPLYVPGSVREPVSVWRCKYPRNPACTQVAVDRAFDDAEACPHCGRALEQGKGALRLPEGTTLRRSTRTSIDPDTGRAKEGELYAHDGLPAGTQLTGLIHGRDAWLELPHTLRIGGRRTVSGAASYEVVPAPQDSPPALTENGTLVVRLISPAVFVDVAGLPRLEPDPALDLDGAEVAARWVRPVVWSGWHAASRLPKPAEICAEAGSTYLIRGDRDRLLQLAERITTEGLGLRRAEGFGFAEIVTQPWCVGLEPAEADRSADPAAGRLAQVRALGLEPPERRWLVSALRGIQVEQQRATTAVKDVLEDMLAQPTAAALSGRQRDAIHTLITELDPAQLRDLSTTVEAMP